jgi:transposase
MDQKIRRVHPPAFKAKVALEAIKETKTIGELASIYSIHPTQITKWKKKALEGLSQIFSEGYTIQQKNTDLLVQELYQQIGRLKVEVDFLKKKMGIFEQ